MADTKDEGAPLLWRVLRATDEDLLAVGLDWVLYAGDDGMAYVYEQEDAARIGRAVNTEARLREALKAVVGAFSDFEGNLHDDAPLYARRARAALAAREEE